MMQFSGVLSEWFFGIVCCEVWGMVSSFDFVFCFGTLC